LGCFGEAGAAHHQPQLAPVPALAGDIDGLGDLGLAAVGVGDRGQWAMASIALRMLGLMRTVIDHATPRRVSVSISA